MFCLVKGLLKKTTSPLKKRYLEHKNDVRSTSKWHYHDENISYKNIEEHFFSTRETKEYLENLELYRSTKFNK